MFIRIYTDNEDNYLEVGVLKTGKVKIEMSKNDDPMMAQLIECEYDEFIKITEFIESEYKRKNYGEIIKDI